MKTPGVRFATKALTFDYEKKYMCMNTSPNVLKMFKLLKIIGRDTFFNQLCIMVSGEVTKEIQNAVIFKMKDVTELEKVFISSSSSTRAHLDKNSDDFLESI